jgi:hypothetical protein
MAHPYRTPEPAPKKALRCRLGLHQWALVQWHDPGSSLESFDEACSCGARRSRTSYGATINTPTQSH